MSYTKILYTVADGVATITLNRPDKLNSFDREMALETIDALDKAKDDANVRAVLLTGEGRAFCAGQDLAEAIAPGTLIEEIISTQYNPIVRRLRSLPKPVVCAVNGVAAGAGANIAYACDLTLAAESANFIQSFINIGLIPDSGGTFTLPRLVGMQRAFGQMILAPKVSAKEAEAQGMIWKAVPDAELMNEATSWRRSWRPDAHQGHRPHQGGSEPFPEHQPRRPAGRGERTAEHRRQQPRLQRGGEGVPGEAEARVPRRIGRSIRTRSVDLGQRVVAEESRMEHRRDWAPGQPGTSDHRHHRDLLIATEPDLRRMDTSMNVAVIGAGTMGSGIAQVAAQAGHAVVLFDTRREAVDKALAGLRKTLDKLVEKGKLTAEQADGIHGRITPASELNDLAGSGLVIEAIIEDLGIKKKLFAELEGILAAGCGPGHEHIFPIRNRHRWRLEAPGAHGGPAFLQPRPPAAFGGSGARPGHG